MTSLPLSLYRSINSGTGADIASQCQTRVSLTAGLLR